MTPERERLLDQLIDAWEEETCASSRHMIEHPYFRAIVIWGQLYPAEMGPALLARMYQDPAQSWVPILALSEIVWLEHHPKFPEESHGRIAELSRIWLSWAGIER